MPDSRHLQAAAPSASPPGAPPPGGGARHVVHAVVLDYGEVLCQAADPEAMARMAIAAGSSAASFFDVYWRFREDYDRGVFDGPGYWRKVSEAAGRSWTPAQVTALIEQDIALWTRFDARMVAWVEALIARGVKVGLLSNMVAEIGRHLKAHLEILARFSHVTYSCEIGSIKPEPRIYQHVLDGLGVPASDALLIDDRQVNIDGAAAIGMHGIRFQGYDELLRAIDQRFVIEGL